MRSLVLLLAVVVHLHVPLSTSSVVWHWPNCWERNSSIWAGPS